MNRRQHDAQAQRASLRIADRWYHRYRCIFPRREVEVTSGWRKILAYRYDHCRLGAIRLTVVGLVCERIRAAESRRGGISP